MKLLELEASAPYLKNFPKEGRHEWKRDKSIHLVLGIVVNPAYRREDDMGH